MVPLFDLKAQYQSLRTEIRAAVDDVFDKLSEEIEELRAAIRERHDAGAEAKAEQQHVREEVGDLLFAVTNIARHLQVEPEAALKLTNRKFRRRFRYIEQSLRARGRDIQGATLEEMEKLWQEAKSLGRES